MRQFGRRSAPRAAQGAPSADITTRDSAVQDFGRIQPHLQGLGEVPDPIDHKVIQPNRGMV
jgi:hypothetical protein